MRMLTMQHIVVSVPAGTEIYVIFAKSQSVPAWKAHTLTGDHKGTWSLSVTANRRLTFRIDALKREIYDVNLEDYH